MPLILFEHPAFRRSLKKLDSHQHKIVGRIMDALAIYYQSNCQIEKARQIESRFFYKQLRKPFYEAGIESKTRIVIRREQSDCYALFVVPRFKNSLPLKTAVNKENAAQHYSVF